MSSWHALILGSAALLVTAAGTGEARLGYQGAPPTEDALRSSLQRELDLADEQGYLTYASRHYLSLADGTTDVQERRRRVLWAKGALLDLKLPGWARDVRYYDDGVAPGDVDPDRGVWFSGLAGGSWAAPASFPGQWFRGHCRPSAAGVRAIDETAARGKPVGTYMSGGMVPITYALLPPDEEEDWTTDFMRRYAGSYWHYGERWWGATGDKPGFADWMLPQLDFAHEVGFDYVHLDEAWGAYPAARALHERHPDYLIVTNNLAMTYVDQPDFRFGWTAMGEGAGSVHQWDGFLANLRDRALKADNLTTWSYLHYGLDDPPFFHDLAYGTALACRTTDVSLGTPSRPMVAFAHRFRDYLLSPCLDVDVPQDEAAIVSASPDARTAVTRRILPDGAEERVVHLFNINPEAAGTGPVELRLTPGGAVVPEPTVTVAVPGQELLVVQPRREGNSLLVTVPGVAIWGLVIVGRPLQPLLQATVSGPEGRRGGPGDETVVTPGETVMVTVESEDLAPGAEPYRVDLRVPPGWEVRPVGTSSGQMHRFAVTIPATAPLDRGWAMTPVAVHAGTEAAGLAVQVITRQRLTFRMRPPCLDSPGTAPAPMELEVANHGLATEASVALSLPEGWQAEPTAWTLKLEGGEVRRLPLNVTAPDQKVSFWYHHDTLLPLHWRAGVAEGRSEVRVRVFPVMFSVYHDGPETNIMHGYPNVILKAYDFEAARRELLTGGHVVLWLSRQDPEKRRPEIEWFLEHGGGVVWMGRPFGGPDCPATAEAPEELVAKGMLLATGDTPALAMAKPVARFRTYYESEQGFAASKVAAADWAEVTATWTGSDSISSPELQGQPAIIVSRDPARRIALMSSELETGSEASYHFEERVHRQCQWYLTYYFYQVLGWAAGTMYVP